MPAKVQLQIACDIRDIALADAGKRMADWAFQSMPVLQGIRKQFIKTQPLAGIRVSACVPVTAESANLIIALKDGGATIGVARRSDEFLPVLRSSPSAVASSSTVVNRGARRFPDSSAVIAAVLRPARAASCSCVSPAAALKRTSNSPNGASSRVAVFVVFVMAAQSWPRRIV